MIPALNKSELDKKVQERYERDEQRIVGLMMIRYSGNNKAYVDDNYSHWDSITSKNFDIFWPGYGNYAINKELVLNFDGNKTHVFFDNNAFIDINNELKDKIKNYNPKDGGPVLILLNYRNGKLDYSQALVVKLFSRYNSNPYALQQTVNAINGLIYKHHDIKNVFFKYKVILENKKNNFPISPMDLINLSISFYGAIPK